MDKWTKAFFVVGIILALRWSSGLEDRAGAPLSAIEGLKSASPEQVVVLTKQISDDRKKTVEALLSVARLQEAHTPGTHTAAQAAVKLLGEYRAPEACEFLVVHIDDFQTPMGGLGTLINPAARALIAIGTPSISSIMSELKKERPAPGSPGRYAAVIFFVEGRTYGLSRLETELALAKGVQRENLLAVKNALERFPAAGPGLLLP